MVKIAVLVSGSGTNLQAIIDAVQSKNINGEIVLVASNKKTAYGLTRASNANIKTLYTKDEEVLLATLEKLNVELVVLAGYLKVISNNFVEKYPNKIINIHPSLIPSFCGEGYYGIHVHEEVYKRGVKVSGATVHFVSGIVDGGPIILQEAIDISKTNSPQEIQELVLNNVEHKLLTEAVKLYCENKIKVINERVEIL